MVVTTTSPVRRGGLTHAGTDSQPTVPPPNRWAISQAFYFPLFEVMVGEEVNRRNGFDLTRWKGLNRILNRYSLQYLVLYQHTAHSLLCSLFTIQDNILVTQIQLLLWRSMPVWLWWWVDVGDELLWLRRVLFFSLVCGKNRKDLTLWIRVSPIRWE
mgnify:CR=1 FL=1